MRLVFYYKGTETDTFVILNMCSSAQNYHETWLSCSWGKQHPRLQRLQSQDPFRALADSDCDRLSVAQQSREKQGLTAIYIQFYLYPCTQFHISCSILLRKLSACKAILSTTDGTWVRFSLERVTELVTHRHCGQISTIQPSRTQDTGSLFSSSSAVHSHVLWTHCHHVCWRKSSKGMCLLLLGNKKTNNLVGFRTIMLKYFIGRSLKAK